MSSRLSWPQLSVRLLFAPILSRSIFQTFSLDPAALIHSVATHSADERLPRILSGARLSLSIPTVVVRSRSLSGGLIRSHRSAIQRSNRQLDNAWRRYRPHVPRNPSCDCIGRHSRSGADQSRDCADRNGMDWLRAHRPRRSADLARARSMCSPRNSRSRPVTTADAPHSARSRRPLAVQATFGVGGIISAEAALSFLGPRRASAHSHLGQHARCRPRVLLVAPHLTTAPGLAIGFSILGFNLLGDGIAQKVGHIEPDYIVRYANHRNFVILILIGSKHT